MKQDYHSKFKRNLRFFFFLAALQLFLTAPAQTYLWQQLGLNINGDTTNDQTGFSVSMSDAHTMAIGAKGNDNVNGINAGLVRIYRWNGNAWVQKGADINGEAAFDESGSSVSMPDSNTVAIGAYANDNANGNNAGHVRIYRWNGNAWVQKGLDIDGEGALDESGSSVSMPDSNTVAIGAYANDNANGSNAGHVRIYRWNGNAWMQKGTDIDGQAAVDQFGISVSMPDNNTVAIGANLNDNANGTNAGHVRIYEWDGNDWVQKGTNIDGEAANDQSGWSVSMPDSTTVAIGAYYNDNANESDAGHVRIYNWNGYAWVQKGLDINGEMTGDWSGYSVDMPDSNTVAVGACFNDNANGFNAGHARVYRWNGSAWLQKGIDLDGIAALDRFGTSVSMPDSNTVAIGANLNDANGQNAGHVRVYSYSCNSTAMLTASSCGSYTAPSGAILTNSGTYTDVIPAVSGCDSIITIHLTILSSSSTVSPSVCNSYTSPGGNTYTVSGSYTDTIPNLAGCDSVITVNLTILSSSSTVFPAVCNSYTSPGGNTYTVSGSYTDTIPNLAGCDSIITINLTILNSSSSVISATACNSYISPGGNMYTISGSYTDTIPNLAGCDSIITINLTINNSPIVTATASANIACVDDGNITLIGIPGGGTWIGPGVNGNSFDPSVAGNGIQVLTYNYSDSNGCSDSAQVSVQVNACVGINELSSTGLQSLYPNPNNGTFTIQLREQTDIIITDALGKTVYAQQLQSGKHIIDLSTLNSGIYFLDANGAKVKVVLQR